MEQAELDRIRQQFAEDVRSRMPDAPIQRIEVLQYGEDPEIEPGQLLARVVIEATGEREERSQALEQFHEGRQAAFRELREELNKLSVPVILQFLAGGNAEPETDGPRFQLFHVRGGAGAGCEPAVPALTPVMARVGAEDLETLDTLIAAGIANSRAEAVRWALARIRERPAYEQLRARTREIQDLKAQF